MNDSKTLEKVVEFLRESYRADFMKADQYEKAGMIKESADLIKKAEITIVICANIRNEFC